MSTLVPSLPAGLPMDAIAPRPDRLALPSMDGTSADVLYSPTMRSLSFGAEAADRSRGRVESYVLVDFARSLDIPADHLRAVADQLDPPRDLAPSWLRVAAGVLLGLLALGCLLAALSALSGCATLGQSPTAQAIVYAAASPAESLAADALGDAIASIPADPSALHGWLVGAGLTDDEADEVGADLLADAQAELSAVALYVDDGAFGRLALSVLGGEKPKTVGPREAARYLLARARVAVPVEDVPVTSGAAP